MGEDSPSVIAAAQLAREAQERTGRVRGRRRRRPRVLPAPVLRTATTTDVPQAGTG
jgi:hypothetical protein